MSDASSALNASRPRRPAHPPASVDQPVREVLFAFVAVTAAVSMLYRARTIAFIDRNLVVIAAVLFLYVPAWILWRRGRDLDQYGLRMAPLARGIGLMLASGAVVLPLFAVGDYWFVHRGCPAVARLIPTLHCSPSLSLALRPPPDFAMATLSQLLVVALPEEFFFRGFMQGRLGEVMKPGRALPLTALLFALGHYLVTFQPASLAVFFPGLLFGLLRHATGSVLAGTLFHAACNLFMEVLHRSVG